MIKVLAACLAIVVVASVCLLATRGNPRLVRKLWLASFVWVIVGGTTMMITHAFVTRWGIRPSSPRDGLWAMMDGTASRPFVFRRLYPEATRVISDWIVHHGPARAVDAYLSSSTLTGIYAHEVMTFPQVVALHVAFVFAWASLFFSVLAGAALVRRVRACSWLEALIAANLTLCLFPTALGFGGYAYDMCEILIATLVVLAVLSPYWWMVFPLFGLMLFNKESGLLFVPSLYPLLAGRLKTRHAALVTLALGLLALAWLPLVRSMFAGLAGDEQEFRLWSNLEFWANPLSYFKFAAVFSPALPAPRGGNVLLLLLLLFPLRLGWAHIPVPIQQATLLAAAMLFPAFLLSGHCDETRVLGPLFPYLLIVCSEGVKQLVATPAESAR